MSEPALVVMAAGIGSRYGGNKQIDSIGPGNETIVDYALYDTLRAGFKKIIFVIRENIEEEFRRFVGHHVESRADVQYVFQELNRVPAGFRAPSGRSKPWGTGHAVLCASPKIDEPFAVINADDYYGARSFGLIYEYLKCAHGNDEPIDGCMAGFVLQNTLSEYGFVSRGVCSVTPDGYLAGIVERTKIRRVDDAVRYAGDDGETWVDIDAQSVVSMNMWGFVPAFLPELESRFAAFLEKNIDSPKAEFYFPMVVDYLIQQGKARVTVLSTDAQWFGITYREDKQKVKNALRELISAGIYPEKLWM